MLVSRHSVPRGRSPPSSGVGRQQAPGHRLHEANRVAPRREASASRAPSTPALMERLAMFGANSREPAPHRSQFSTSSPRTRANSPSLFVTMTRAVERAWAAISMSLPPIGRPSASSRVLSSA